MRYVSVCTFTSLRVWKVTQLQATHLLALLPLLALDAMTRESGYS